MTEILFYLVFIYYYLFCVFAAATYIQDGKYTISKAIVTALLLVIISPVCVPIVLGIKIGLKMKE